MADARFIAAMLSVPCEARYGPLQMTPQKLKDETLRTLADIAEAAARRHPSLVQFEMCTGPIPRRSKYWMYWSSG